MASEAQRRAVQAYKQKVKRISVEFSPAEADLWEHIQSQPNKQGYIKSLIRADMKGAGKMVKVMLNDEVVYFESCVALMDDEIREELHRELAPCTEQEFLDAYIKRHHEKYNEDFTI